jgi:putative stress-responsive envelope protein
MLDLKSGGALVAGSPPQSKEQAKMKVKALSGFYVDGKLVEAGTEIEVDENVGNEVVTSNKAVRLDKAKAAAGTEDQFDGWTNDELRAYLDKKKVEYPSGATKAELTELAKSA